MPLETESATGSDGVERAHAWDSDHPEEKHLAYEIDAARELISFYPREDFPTDVVAVKGYKRLPEGLDRKGYFKSGLTYFIRTRLEDWTIESFVISRTDSSSIR